jgi:hypothetical protein
MGQDEKHIIPYLQRETIHRDLVAHRLIEWYVSEFGQDKVYLRTMFAKGG